MIIFLQQHRCYFNVIDYKHTPVNVPVSPLEQGFLGQLKKSNNEKDQYRNKNVI